MKRGIPFRFQGKWMETQTRTWSKFRNGRKANVGQQLGFKKINKLKKAEMSVSQSGIHVGKLITNTDINISEKKLQSVTKYLSLTLIFMWNKALQGKFNCYFSSINQISILAGRLGTRLSFYEV